MALDNKVDNKKESKSSPYSDLSSDLKKMLYGILFYIKKRGLCSSLLIFVNSLRERLWFITHRKSAITFKDFNIIEKNLDNQTHSTFYAPTPIIPFFKLVRKLDLPTESVFVDYGAGKGRAMILAAESGRFSKIKGLEFSPSLYKIGQKNTQYYAEKKQIDYFHLMNTDVLDYEVKSEDNFFYFFHPFDATILEKCLENIYASLKTTPRRALLIYQSNTKDYTNFISKEGSFKLQEVFKSFGVQFYVYKSNFQDKI